MKLNELPANKVRVGIEVYDDILASSGVVVKVGAFDGERTKVWILWDCDTTFETIAEELECCDYHLYEDEHEVE